MLVALPAVTSAASSSAVRKLAASLTSGAKSLLDPAGANRDRQREAKAQAYLDDALQGSVTAARYMLGGLKKVENEARYYRPRVATLTNQRPDVIAEARQLGDLWDDAAIPTASASKIEEELSRLGTEVRKEVASTVQRVTAGAGSEASDAITGNDSAVTIPTSKGTIFLVVVGLVVAYLALRK